MGNRKKYDSNLHKSVEDAEGDFIKKIFRPTDFNLVKHPLGIYDIDIGIKKSGEVVGFIEIESRKDSWTKGDFSFPSISLLERKYRYIEKYKNYCLFYVGFRSDLRDCYCFSSDIVLNYSKKSSISHREGSIGEDVDGECRYRIPVEKAVWGIGNTVSYICGFSDGYLNFKDRWRNEG